MAHAAEARLHDLLRASVERDASAAVFVRERFGLPTIAFG